MPELTLASPVNMTVRAAEQKSVSKLNIKRIVKIPDDKKILVMTAELPRFIVVYDDKDYGDYTDAQIMTKLSELAVSGFTFSN
jgi:hypothetical protein